MKTYIQMFIFVGSCFIVLPFFLIRISNLPVMTKNSDHIESIEDENSQDLINEDTLIGILAKEVPYTYEIEAIKAQAVVERTYMARRILGIQSRGAIVGYTIEEMKALWGEHYDLYYKLYQQAIRDTKGKLILYKGKPIEAVYHSASSGMTRDAKDVYQKDIPYLKGVENKLDIVSKQQTYKKDDIVQKIQAKYPSLMVEPEKLQDQIQIVAKDKAGYVLMIQIGNITLTGEELKTLLDLPSTAFKIFDKEESLLFDTRGVGVGVGLSQNGANELAKQGMGYDQILHYYYNGVTLEAYEFQS